MEAFDDRSTVEGITVEEDRMNGHALFGASPTEAGSRQQRDHVSVGQRARQRQNRILAITENLR